jgi:hypothetical protein
VVQLSTLGHSNVLENPDHENTYRSSYHLCLVAFNIRGIRDQRLLVFEIERYSYSAGNTHVSDIHQKFKVPLTEEFMSNFKHVPSQNSSGTGFCCSGGNLKANQGSTRFMWWIRKTVDNRWSINMWGDGVETIDGITVNSRNPKSSQSLVIKRLEDLDMSYMLSYVNTFDGINIAFTAKYVSAKDIEAEGDIHAAPVRKADRTELFKGDDLKHFPVEVSCIFQEG